MFEVLRSFWAPKTSGYEHEYEDAADWNPSRGVAAIADGVSTAIFSRAWAQILTAAVVADPPAELTVNGSLTEWLAPHRQAWSEQVDLPKLKWNQVAKLNQVGGGWATLLWLHLEECSTAQMENEVAPAQDSDGDPSPNHSDDDSASDDGSSVEETSSSTKWSLTCHAIGDCNLFVVRDGQLLLSHPMQSSAAYAQNPQAVCSMNRGQDGQLNPLTTTFDCQTGDTLFLCTDAIGKWLWSELEEQNREFDWQGLNDWTDEQWQTEVERLRGELRMPIDDCTLIVLRVSTNAPVPPASTESQSELDPASDNQVTDNHVEIEIEFGTITDESDVAAITALPVECQESMPSNVEELAVDAPVSDLEPMAESEVDRAVVVADSATVESLPEA